MRKYARTSDPAAENSADLEMDVTDDLGFDTKAVLTGEEPIFGIDRDELRAMSGCLAVRRRTDDGLDELFAAQATSSTK